MTGNPTLDVFAIMAIIAAGLGLLFVLARIWRRVWLMFRSLDDFLDDWQGAASRPGVPARLGVLERLHVIEHEVQTNDGSSLKDAVNSIEKKLTEHIRSMED